MGWDRVAGSFLIGIEPDPARLSEWGQIEGWLSASRRRSQCEGQLIGPHDVLWVARQFMGEKPVARAVGCATAALSEDGRSIIVGDLGGNGLGWIAPLLAELTKWAKAEGAADVRALCRPGWRRILPALGCVQQGDWFVKEVP